MVTQLTPHGRLLRFGQKKENQLGKVNLVLKRNFFCPETEKHTLRSSPESVNEEQK